MTPSTTIALDHSVVGTTTAPFERSWSSDDAMLYALAVGAGREPRRELAFTTENSEDVELAVLPTYAIVLIQSGVPRASIGDVDPSRVVHGEQEVILHAPLPVSGTVDVTSTVTGIYDKGSGALATRTATAIDRKTGEPLATTRWSSFIRGAGGFGGKPAPSSDWERPDRQPDVVGHCETRPEQALLYRLCGDRNPLHSDPVFAERGGFERPILHGLCSYGIAGRLLLGELCDGVPGRFRSMAGRFTAPVLPGAELHLHAWREDGAALFQVLTDDGRVAIDRGRFEWEGA